MNRRIANLLARKAKLLADARAVAENEESTAEEIAEKTDEILAEVEKIDKSVATLKQLLAKEEEDNDNADDVEDSTPAPAPEERSSKNKVQEARSAIFRYLQSGKAEEARSTSGAITTSNAGVLLPRDVATPAIQAVKGTSFIRDAAVTQTIAAGTKVPVFSDAANFAAVGEGVPAPVVDLEIGGPTLEPMRIAGIVKVTIETLKLAAEGEEGTQNSLLQVMQDGLSNSEENYFLNGNGTTEPQGVFTAAPVKVTDDEAVTADGLNKLFYSLLPRFRRNGAFVMSSLTAAHVRGLTDPAGNPIWQPAGLHSDVETLYGRPVYVSEYAPEMEAGKKAVVFGDFSFYRIGERGEQWVKMLDQNYAESGKVGILLTSFLDAKVALPKAFAALAIADE